MAISVSDAHITGEVIPMLDKVRYESSRVRDGANPTLPDRVPTQRLEAFDVKAGSQQFELGWELAQRVKWQAHNLYGAVTGWATFLGDFTRNAKVFVEDTDETELENISAETFESYFPGT